MRMAQCFIDTLATDPANPTVSFEDIDGFEVLANQAEARAALCQMPHPISSSYFQRFFFATLCDFAPDSNCAGLASERFGRTRVAASFTRVWWQMFRLEAECVSILPLLTSATNRSAALKIATANRFFSAT
jgi:hypothetical protein